MRQQGRQTLLKRRTGRASHGAAAAAEGPFEPDLARAEQLLLRLLALPGRSGGEGAVMQFIRDALLAAGVPAAAVESDAAHRRSPIGGEVGNLVCRLSSSRRVPRRLLLAHTDTVPLCLGTEPVVRGHWIASGTEGRALGADDRTGVAVVLATALEVVERQLPHPPLSFLFTVQEEAGLLGARHLRVGMLGRPQAAFNFDGGAPERLTVGATGGYRMEIEVRGLAAHAGGAPERGVSAITVASLAVADLVARGWHGRIEKRGRRGTSNIGVFRGGEATNVVAPHVFLRAEARSHHPAFRTAIVRAIEQAFRRAARKVRSADGRQAEVVFRGRLDYEAFRLADDAPCTRIAEGAVRAIGGEPVRNVCDGGLDGNWLNRHGIPTVTLGCGQTDPHTPRERVDLKAFRRACRVALWLATTIEPP